MPELTKWKFGQKLAEVGIKSLDDSDLSSDFVSEARSFLETANNPEASEQKLNELDEKLVMLFETTHEIIEEEDQEKVRAISENEAYKRELKEMKSLLKNQNEWIAEQKRKEQEKRDKEKAKKEAEEAEAARIAKEKEEQAEKGKQANTWSPETRRQFFIKAYKGKMKIHRKDLVKIGVPEKLATDPYEFNFEGFLFERLMFGKYYVCQPIGELKEDKKPEGKKEDPAGKESDQPDKQDSKD